MKNKKNRRTLKKRIRNIISLSTFLTIAFFSVVIMIFIGGLTRHTAAALTKNLCNSITEKFSSEETLKALKVNNINQIEKNGPEIKAFLEGIVKESEISILLNYINDVTDILPYASESNNIFIKIEGASGEIFSNEDGEAQELQELYEDTKFEAIIYDSIYRKIGTVQVRLNPELLLMIDILSLTFVIPVSLLALVVSSLFSKLFTIPIITPINQLETKVKAIADDDHQTAVDTEIILKRPLREIESLAESTNKIVKKFKGFNDILEIQKEALEDQNQELEAQNEQLLESKLEIQRQQGQLLQSEKMASVGLLTAAITHEINTPIGAINSNTQLEEMILNSLTENGKLQSDEEVRVLINQLKEANEVNLMACSRIIEIIKSLKSYSRLDQAEFQEANINEGIKSVLVLTNNLLKRRINVYEELGDIPLLRCFPGQLNQVFMNLIVNASQAIENEGEIYIKTYSEDRYVYITIRDTGTGIREEDKRKIFNPGFTTKGVGVGLGLGLYISYNIIQNHRGEISFNSEEGKGTEFIIKLPIDN